MLLPLASALAPLVVLDSADSTNDELRARAAGAPDFLTVVTTDQRRGRGRMLRRWSTPPGRGLAASVLVPVTGRSAIAIDRDSWGWIPLLAGAAMTLAVRGVLPAARVALKWPNDVLIAGRKVSGILSEVLPDESGLVVGAGVNLGMTIDELPTSTSTSLVLEGSVATGDDLVDAVLGGWLRELRRLHGDLVAAAGSADPGAVRDEVVALCGTIGRRVDVQLPLGAGFAGTAVGLDQRGRLRVRRDPAGEGDGVVESVAAGDVVHLR